MSRSSKLPTPLFSPIHSSEQRLSHKDSKEVEQSLHLRPVWIVLFLLIPCVALTVYWARFGGSSGSFGDSLLPSPSYALVLFLVYLDIVGLVALTLLLSRNLIRAYFERRHRLLGSGFRTKLIAAFVGFSLVPTVLLAFVASGVINEVMKLWFNEQIERVLKDSEEMARRYHEGHTALAVKSARAISQEIVREDMLFLEHRELLSAAMARKRSEYNLAGVGVFSSKLELLVRMTDSDVPVSVLNLPVSQIVVQVLEGGKEATSVQEAQVGRLIRAGVPITGSLNTEEIRGVVVVDAYVSESLLSKMEGIARQYTDYLQIKAMENPIKAGAYLFVAVVAVLLLFSATWFGFYVARGITVPIQKLAEGTEAIARGDLDVRIAVKAQDEIGTLVDSFNRMTADLQTSKGKLEEMNQSLMQSNVESDRRRAYTEAVVDTIASGVLSVDAHAVITTFNHSAERILAVEAQALRGRSMFEVFKEREFVLFQEAYDRLLVDGHDSFSFEGQMEVEGKLLTIGLNLSRVRNEARKELGFVFVFEDRTDLIKAQKAAAWQEVAQRIAHEIKNPLTPIQLSAQRLRKKFFEQAPDFQDIFDQSTGVIVNEVTSLKCMIDEFSKFARMPGPRMMKESLHEVIEQVITLYAGAHRDIEFILSLEDDLPPVNIDREQIRRVFVNLFDNAIQAMDQKGKVWVATAVNQERRHVRVTVADEGHGIRQDDQPKLFVPYFSKKRTGTGLGLAIVHRIVRDHNGSISAANHRPKGAVFTIELPI
ncbi:MAG: HAMP domain-containing protein [Nitrospirales bacterium]|nr:HAMP domain-containing protein [Nitrospirales bacterium]